MGHKCLLISGVVLGVVVAAFMGSFRPIYNAVVNGQLVLKEGKSIMDAFITPPVPIYMNFYFFDVLNARDVQYYGARPQLNEIGPYVYEEVRTKYDLSFLDKGTRVQYLQNKTYFFREDLSNGLKESDKVTTLNLVMVMLAALGYKMENMFLIWPEFERTMNVFETFTISEALFEGWQLPEFDFDFSDTGIPVLQNISYSGTLYDIMLQMGVPDENIPDTIKSNAVGYYSTMNNTNDGVYKVSTGKGDISEYIYVKEWNGDTALKWWDDEYCDMINGTDGTQFPPRQLDKDFILRIFVTELCRSLYLRYEQDIDFNGLRTLRFVPPPEMLMSPNLNNDNKCFCSTFGCLGSSLMEMTPCLGIPIISSTPHFYQGDGDQVAKYDGLNASKDEHETKLDVEPTLGVPVSAHKRIQINLPLQPYGNLTSFMNFNDMFFPVLWADETAELSQSDIETLKNVVHLPFIIGYSIGGVLLLGALIMFVTGFVKFRRLKNSETT